MKIASKYLCFPILTLQMGKFKGSKGQKGSQSVDDENDDALQKVLANGYTSENDRALPGRPGRRRMGPMGKWKNQENII